MRMKSRRPGTSTTFADASSGEGLLQVASDADGLLLMAYHLYDSSGSLVADSDGLGEIPDGLTVRCSGGEVLLDVPANASDNVRYRLYNSGGSLLTTSDGVSTMIYPLLRMEGVGRNWARPAG